MKACGPLRGDGAFSALSYELKDHSPDMPLREYECKECGRRTEKIQKFSDPELTVCPFCSGPLERTLTAPAVHFSGGGWYKDLYSSAKPAAAAGAEGKSEGKGESAAPAASGDAKAAPAAPAASSSAPAAAPAAAPASSSAPAKS